jgi:spore maturation protein CgeB
MVTNPTLLNIHMGQHNPLFLQALENAFFDCAHIDWTSYHKNTDALQYDILKAAEELNPDYVFMHTHSGDALSMETIKKLSVKSKVINWTGDVRYPLPQHYIDIGKEIFLTLFSNVNDVEAARKHKVNADFLQVGFDDVAFSPMGHTNTSYPPILFLGSNYAHNIKFPLTELRQQMVDRLKREYGQFFGVYGHGWAEANGNINTFQEEGAAYRSCKIAINLSHFDYKRYSSDRLFRIMGSGAFCLTHNYPEIEKDFEVGKELVVWKNLDDLVATINYYLNNPVARNEIALAGCLKARTTFTWNNFAENLITLINEHENKLGTRHR